LVDFLFWLQDLTAPTFKRDSKKSGLPVKRPPPEKAVFLQVSGALFTV
jgi:hypothetical protein